MQKVVVHDRGFTQSYFPRNGTSSDEVVLRSFVDAVRSYDFEGDITATQSHLDGLASNIDSVLKTNSIGNSEQQLKLLVACLNVLVWGGVTVESTIEWLAKRASEGDLCEAIKNGSSALGVCQIR